MKKKKRKNKKTKPKKKNKNDLLSSIKLRIYPTNKQKLIINQWIGSSRFLYNKCLSYIKQEFSKNLDIKDILNIKILREKFINNKNFETENTWMLKIPYDIRDEALRDLLHNYKTNFEKFKKTKKPFELKYKSKKDSINSISVLGKHWNKENSVFSDVFTSTLNCEKNLPKTLDYTSRLIKTKLNEYFICIPQLRKIDKKRSGDNQTIRTISIDPGVRTFLTCYDPDGLALKIGSADIERLHRLYHYKTKLQSKISKTIGSSKYRLKKAFNRISKKINSLVEDCHKKVALFLCSNYNLILIPKLNFHNFKNLKKKNKIRMKLWNHCLFVDRLLDKSMEFQSCSVKVVEEDYTSKTCGHCGILNENLGSKETFKCCGCLSEMDRDLNGARCILLKNKNLYQTPKSR